MHMRAYKVRMQRTWTDSCDCPQHFSPKSAQRPHLYLRTLQYRSSCLLHLFSWVILTSFHIGLIPFVQLALGISVLFCLNGKYYIFRSFVLLGLLQQWCLLLPCLRPLYVTLCIDRLSAIR